MTKDLVSKSEHSSSTRESTSARPYRLVKHPQEPLEGVVNTPPALARVCELVAAGSGSVALDTERAGAFRYFQGAYLVQLRREDTGTFLIDPTAFPDLEPLGAAIGKAEWILHDATTDMPWLAEIGMRPKLLFDTELAAKLLNFERFGLGSLTEQVLGIMLEKEHSAADWSTRPLPQSWLEYAALDVEFLVDLRQALWLQLGEAGKDDWAEQEFEHLLYFEPPAPKPDPWRHVPGSGKVYSPRNLAALRELWQTREKICAAENLAPTKVLSNPALIALAVALPRGKRYMNSIEAFRNDRVGRERADTWYAALSRSYKLPVHELPSKRAPRVRGAVPDARNFAHNHPQEAERWHRLRDVVIQIAAELNVHSEVMLDSRTTRRLAWVLPDNAPEPQVLEVLQASEARPWQIEHLLDGLVKALRSE